MSIDDSGPSHYNQMKASRLKVNSLLGFGSTNSSPNTPRCLTCLEAWKLQISTNAEGKRIGKCIKGCGQEYVLDSPADQATNSKYTTRYGQAQGQKHSTFILSQPRRKSNTQAAEDELKEDISKLTGASDGIVIRESQETTYDANGAPT